MLLEVFSAQVWWDGVDDQVTFGDKDYRDFIEWLQGQCYPSVTEAREVFNRREQV
jgi:hypothetical protein